MKVLLSAVLMIFVFPNLCTATELFSGFIIDNKEQYFGYIGTRIPVTKEGIFAQTSTGGFGYSSQGGESTHVQFLNPGIGVERSVRNWTGAMMVGSQLRRYEEQGKGIYHRSGALVQLEVGYYGEKYTIFAMGNYGTLDNFFWGKIRGKVRVVEKFSVGLDVAGMGNAGYRAIQSGPLIEYRVNDMRFVLKSGYQYDTVFQNAMYGGVEMGMIFGR